MTARQLSDKRSDGTYLGQSATDLVGFFGKTARVQITAIASVSAAETTANVKSRLNKVIQGLKNLGLAGS